ncbi:hypothetical protein M422DRAFT_43009 [Sphaerobolus stellatus SS14]|nr:hypothetical protein M422DRAFT_43009 [Sphaerobolus stellatus SS14]
MSASTIPSYERESQLLRASVIEAAFILGPKVANLIFDSPIDEEEDLLGSLEELEYDQLPTPGLTSASSEDSHSTGLSSHDGYRGFATSRIGKSSHPEISLPLPLGTASKTTLVNGFYLNSPFVVVDEQFPTSSATSITGTAEPQTPRKKSLKVFRFKRNKATAPIPPSVEAPQPPMPRSYRIFPNLDDPIESPPSPPSPVPSPPRSYTPVSTSPSNNNSSTRLTPSKLRKQVSRQRDWDFKDPDRPSFFLDQQYVRLDARDAQSVKRSASTSRDKPRNRTRQGSFEEDAGYLSEGSGLRSRGRAKNKGSTETENSSRGLFSMRKWSSGDLKREPNLQREPIPPVPRAPTPSPASLPIAARFARYGESISSPNSSFSSSRSYNPPYGSSSRDTFSSSVSSFALMPDLNAAKRLGLDKYASRKDGAVGSDNDLKLEMLAKLLTERPIPRLEAEDANRMLSKRGTMYRGEPIERLVLPQLQIETSFGNNSRPNEQYERGRDQDRRDLQRQESRSRSRAPPPKRHERQQESYDSSRNLQRQDSRSRSRAPPLKRQERQQESYDSGYRSGSEIDTRGAYYQTPDMNFTGRAVRAQSPVRGKQQPFPVKSILRNAPPPPPPQRTNNLYVPLRYQGLDVPRSVKSSYSKDIEPEEYEEEEPEEEPEEDESDSISVYSRYSKYIDDDAGSRASFMEPERSGRARERLIARAGY